MDDLERLLQEKREAALKRPRSRSRSRSRSPRDARRRTDDRRRYSPGPSRRPLADDAPVQFKVYRGRITNLKGISGVFVQLEGVRASRVMGVTAQKAWCISVRFARVLDDWQIPRRPGWNAASRSG